MKDELIFIEHMFDSIKLIEDFTENIRKNDFMNNVEKQSAVIRQIEIIGEAVKNISDSFRGKHPKIPWKEISGMRDKLIHNYFGVDLDSVWNVVKYNLPELKKQLKTLIDKEKIHN